MPNKQPIILCAFANDAQHSLKLEKEVALISEKLAPAHDARKIEFQALYGTTLDRIYKTFNRFHNRIHVFHFAGHSDAEFLNLQDRKARASNLSALMGMQKELQLVFLNGCSNNAQVEDLLAQGVKAIIATNAPIFGALSYWKMKQQDNCH